MPNINKNSAAELPKYHDLQRDLKVKSNKQSQPRLKKADNMSMPAIQKSIA